MIQTTVEHAIRQALPKLTSAEARVARALLCDYPTVALAPVAEFAQRAQASPATVLRFVSQIGFPSYPDFQKRLREELSERIKSPLDRTLGSGPDTGADFLPQFLGRVGENIDHAARSPPTEFEAFATLVARAGSVHFVGGRFTDPIAAYMAAHLRIIRPNVRKLEDRAVSRIDQLLDLGPRDVVVILDIRRYDNALVHLAQTAKSRRAKVLLVTDTWISPVARYARHVLPCQVEMGMTWDSNTALFAVAEAIIARVSACLWDSAAARVRAIEAAYPDQP